MAQHEQIGHQQKKCEKKQTLHGAGLLSSAARVTRDKSKHKQNESSAEPTRIGVGIIDLGMLLVTHFCVRVESETRSRTKGDPGVLSLCV